MTTSNAAQVIPGRRVRNDLPTTGPRGGVTTVTNGMIRKNLWITNEENEALRLRSYNERKSQSDIIREGLRQALRLAALAVAFIVAPTFAVASAAPVIAELTADDLQPRKVDHTVEGVFTLSGEVTGRIDGEIYGYPFTVFSVGCFDLWCLNPPLSEAAPACHTVEVGDTVEVIGVATLRRDGEWVRSITSIFTPLPATD